MGRVATIPAETDLLCEACGYVLNGLPRESNCPECGKPIAESAASRRTPPGWERGRSTPGPPRGGLVRFIGTSAAILLRPSSFFRHLSLRPDRASRQFALVHWLLASALFGWAVWAHMNWSDSILPSDTWAIRMVTLVLLIGATFVATLVLNHVAARLTAWEAAYRGIRLPKRVVLRGLDYHAPHYLPIAVRVAAVIFGYQIIIRYAPNTAGLYATTYLYVLCGAIVIGAIYSFKTYWIAMRNLMYGNSGQSAVSSGQEGEEHRGLKLEDGG
jgi:hypothetical protein